MPPSHTSHASLKGLNQESIFSRLEVHVICPSCHAQNDPLALACFHCESPLPGHAIRRGMVIGGRYEILKWLGRGGMGTVYEAYDRVLEEEVAIKVLRAEVAASSDLTRRFRSEIKLARRVRQPNVCAIHEYGEDGDLRYISMELIDGTDLKRLIQESGRFDTNEAFDVTRQVAEGLKAIHAIGVIHRDLKTANIMLDGRRLVHVMDFGIAKQYGREASASATVTGHILGTPEYMSPEQARGEPLDPRTDIYALGIVMFEIFTGEVPFHGDTPVATLFKQLQDPPPVHDPRLPHGLSAILEKALAKDARDRYANVADLIEDLDRARRASVEESAHAADWSIEATVTEKAPHFEDGVDTAARTPTFVPPPTLSDRKGATAVRERNAPASTIGSSGVKLAPMGVPPAIPPSLTTQGQPHLPRPAPPPLPQSATPPSIPKATASRPMANASTPSDVRRYALAAAAIGVAGVLTAVGISRLMERSPDSNAGLTRLSPAASLPLAPPISLSSDLTADSATVEVRPPSMPPESEVTPEMAADGVTRPRASTVEGISPPRARDHARREAKKPRMPPVLPALTAPSRLTLPSDDGAHSDATRAPTTAPAPVVEATGLLQIVVRPWAEVSVDGFQVGTTPFRPLKLAGGPHTVVFTHPDYKPFRRQVTVRPGETARLEVDLTWEAFRK